MGKTYLAVDIGASSGRLMLGQVKDGAISMRQIHRFPNEATMRGAQLCWDVQALYAQIGEGLALCAKEGLHPVSLGVDTWGVDYVLLDGDGRAMGQAIAYRDASTQGAPEKVAQIVPQGAQYLRTGIQETLINTIYQLSARKASLMGAHRLLFMPDYLHYLLCGVAANEYTIASTSGLVDAQKKDWDAGLLEAIGVPKRLFSRPVMPGTKLGPLLPQVQRETGLACDVVLPASHDTASAVLAVPAQEEDFLYISSGTWSLLGTEIAQPILSEAAREAGLTNEGGYGGRYRLLKNIMGLWMLQQVRKESAGAPSFPALAQRARMAAAAAPPAIVDVNHPAFLAPQSMSAAVKDVCAQAGQRAPKDEGEVLACIYHSLAASYAQTIKEIEKLTGKTYATLHIVGGGCQDAYLNQLTANATGKDVQAGPIECTALGNLLCQMLADGTFTDVKQARAAVRASYPPTHIRATQGGCDV